VRGITSSDVARRAGVSRATVSYVLNDARSTIRISPDTRERVLRAAAELGYTPNRAAQSLRSKRTGILAYIYPGTTGTLDYFNAQLMTCVQLATQERGFIFSLFSFESPESLKRAIAFLGGHGADGVFAPEYEGPMYEAVLNLARRGLPVVTQGVSLDPAIHAVGFDLEAGGYLATSHLLGLGHERIAYIAADVPPWPRPERYTERYDGYLRAHVEAGIEPRPEWRIVEAVTREGGARAARRLVALPPPLPTAIFVHNDWMALGVLQGLHDAGVMVPDEMAVVGFDGLDLGAATIPPLTTVELPYEEFGRQAVAIIAARLDGGPVPPSHLLTPRLVERRSSGAHAEYNRT
jgi:LacI family transcriptional regulator, repressor for deo operon, udp, cdd, tsx, nupC, and nupG